MAVVSVEQIDNYLRGLEEPKQSTLQALRRTILDVIPDAEQAISYGMPAFRIHGTMVAGFAAFKNHLSYLPHSGTVLGQLADDLAGYTMTKGSLHFPVDQPAAKGDRHEADRRASQRGRPPHAVSRSGPVALSSTAELQSFARVIARQSALHIARRLPAALNAPHEVRDVRCGWAFATRSRPE